MTDAAFWDKIAPKYAKDAIADLPAYEQTRDRMRDILQPHHRVLELGCGTGSTALELADQVDRYHGTDVSPGMIAIAQGKQSDETPAHLSFSARAAGDLPKGPHDVVIALNLFHLLPNLETVLETVWDTLQPGGLLITKTPLLGGGKWYMRLLMRLMIPVMRALRKAPYVRFLSSDELHAMLRTAGFDVTETLLQAGTVPREFTVATKPETR